MAKWVSALKDLLFVPRCAACHTRMLHMGNGLCEDCLREFAEVKEEFCETCGFSVSTCRCIPFAMVTNGCGSYRKLVYYKLGKEPSAVRNLIYSIKRQKPLDAIRFAAKELANADGFAVLPGTVVTFAPRSARAVRKYGYDQGKYLASDLAEEIGCAFADVFVRSEKKQSEQKLLNHRQRAANVKGAFVIRDPAFVAGKNFLIVDDVVTSGATLGECISLLYKAGAAEVSAASIAYTYRKNKSKKD